MATMLANNGDARIALDRNAAGQFTLSVTNPIAAVRAFLDGNDEDELRDLSNFLGILSQQRQPWDEALDLHTADGTLAVEMTCDVTGHVTVTVSIQSHATSFETTMTTALGQAINFGREGAALLDSQ